MAAELIDRGHVDLVEGPVAEVGDRVAQAPAHEFVIGLGGLALACLRQADRELAEERRPFLNLELRCRVAPTPLPPASPSSPFMPRRIDPSATVAPRAAASESVMATGRSTGIAAHRTPFKALLPEKVAEHRYFRARPKCRDFEAMELGGFEPPTSWVRFRDLPTRCPQEFRMASGFAPLAIRRQTSPICAEMRRLSGCSGRNADFCLIGRPWVQSPSDRGTL
jgi:hypothetical protein